MSSTSTPSDSPASIQPMHNPSQAAHVVVPQAPLGNATNGTVVAPGMGMKAFLAKKLAKSNNPNFVSPTDNMVTPVTQKLNAAKQKRFAKWVVTLCRWNMADDHQPEAQSQRALSSRTKRKNSSHWMNSKAGAM
ncbi:hypothetical protein EV363DRAFT_532536 [Boletus edulis]|nr:hypothetical protein EV363DRAFT_532536 [Boletus edulis]